MKLNFMLFLSGVVMAMLLTSCNDDSGPCTNCGDLDQLLQESYTKIEADLFRYQQDDFSADRPSDIDFQDAYDSYLGAHNADEANEVARFGLAVCDLLILGVDDQVNSAFDAWDNYLQDNTPFARPDKNDGHPLGLPLGMPSNSSLALPFDLVTWTATANIKSALAGNEPQVAEVQDILLNVVLPKAQQAINMLGPVCDDLNFTFPISGAMQGDVEMAPLEIDHTDVLALRAACRLLVAGINVATAYDVQFASYTAEGMVSGLDRDTGNISRLRPGAAARMSTVPQMFTDAAEDIADAIDALLAEQDNQDDDVIVIGPDGIARDDLMDIKNDYLPDVKRLVQPGGTTRTEDWDGDSQTPDLALNVDLHAFLNNPVADWKLVLPPYTITSTYRPYDGYQDFHGDEVLPPVSMDVPVGDYTDGVYGYVQISDFGAPEYYGGYEGNSFEDFETACLGFANTKWEEWRQDPDWVGNASFSFNASNLVSGQTQSVAVSVSFSSSTASTFVAVPVVTWAANNYAQWQTQWTNFTVNGLLPGMDSAAELCDVFGYSDDQWEKSFVYDWTEGDEASPPVPPAR